MLDDGVYASISDIGEAENISKSYVSRILRLVLLAPDILDAILAGRTDQSLTLKRMEQPLPASWEEQRRKIFPASDGLSSPRPPSLSDRQRLIRPWGEHLNMR
jgi:hypothetical protein